MSISASGSWPTFKTYSDSYLRKIAMPLGGIGTGVIALGGRGDWKNFEIVNRPSMGFTPPYSFFALRTESDGEVFCRVLEGPIALEDYEGADGCHVPQHGMPRFQSAQFNAAYPLSEVVLQDEASPLDVKLQAFNPFVVNDVEASAWPVAVARFVLTNTSEKPVSASISGSFQNFIGTDGVDKATEDNENVFVKGEDFSAVLGRSRSLEADSHLNGTFALGVLEKDVTYRTSWNDAGWGGTILDFWDEFSATGQLVNVERPHQKSPAASIASSFELAPGETREVTFVWAWNFPNRLTWSPEGQAQWSPGQGGAGFKQGGEIVGNKYSTRFTDAADVLAKFVPKLAELEAKTVAFTKAFYENDLPAEIKEATGFNLSTLRSPTVFQTADGHFFGWEGVAYQFGSCFGNCTHVWNYEQATAFLFPEIALDFRRLEFEYMTDDTGLQHFRVGQPVDKYATTACGHAAADGQCGSLIKLYREWRLNGDDEFLREMWPKAKKALEFCWIKGGWDADRDGVMEGCQHNTMDVEYFGPNPQMQYLYLAALQAVAQMADFVGEPEFAADCRSKVEFGAKWTLENLWNGEYFEHHIVPAKSPDDIAPGLRVGMGADELSDPALQLGAGCLVDQLFGVWLNEICGLEPLLDNATTLQTLNSILTYNRRDHTSVNNMRSYALGDEPAVIMASYPRGNRPVRPFPYFAEVMTGFEHCVASHLLYLGEYEKAAKMITDTRDRYDGRKRNPFDEAECGRHYARAMASYGHVTGYTGFDFDGRTGSMSLRASETPTTWFWSTGRAWGTVKQEGSQVTLSVLGGDLTLKEFKLRGVGSEKFETPRLVGVGETVELAF